MRRWFVGLIFGLAAICILTPTPAVGQASATTPYTPPRTRDGHPDLQGVWQVLNTAAWDLEDHNARLGVPAGQGVVEGGAIPYQPSALARKKENFDKRASLDPETKCYLPGVPRITYMPHPFQIVQSRDVILIAYQYASASRGIPIKARTQEAPVDTWMGDSVGHWEGNTLVIDVTNLNAKFRLSVVGDFFSDKAHIVERLTFVDANTMTYQATITDPTVFTRPWTLRVDERRVPDAEMWEFACYEGERSADHLLLKTEADKK